MPIKMDVPVDASFTDHLSLLFFALGMAIFACWAAWRNHFFALSQPTELNRLNFWELCGAFVVFFLTMTLMMPLLALAWLSWQQGYLVTDLRLHLNTLNQGWLNVCSIMTSLGGLLIYGGCLPERAWRAVWGANAYKGIKQIGKDWLVGAAAWFISYPFVVVISQLIVIMQAWLQWNLPLHEQVAVHYLKMTAAYPFLFAVTALLLISVAPLVEELLFRGFLQTWLKGKFGLKIAIAATSLIFALFHYSASQGGTNLELLLSLFVLSCFLGFLFERQQSLWASVGLHSTFNAVSVAVVMMVV